MYVHTYSVCIHTNKRASHKHPLTSPTAVGIGTTTQETECEHISVTCVHTKKSTGEYEFKMRKPAVETLCIA